MTNTFSVEQETVDTSVLDLFAKTEDVLTSDPFIEDTRTTNILQDKGIDKTLDNAIPKPKTVEAKNEEVIVDTKEVENILDSTATELETEVTDETPTTDTKGRPKTDKNALVSYLTAKVEANEFGIPEDAPFDATKQTVAEYLSTLPEKELHNLLDSNWKAKEDEIRAQTPQEFFDSLPEELQYAAAYVAEGGQDLKGLFKALSHVEEVRELDPEKEADQVVITRSYLQATGWQDEAINEQIEEWKESNKIEKKAKEFKPALDNMQKQQVQAYQKQAEEQKQQQMELAQFYAQNVNKALEKSELAGIKLEKKFAKELESNMVSTVAGPWSGRPVNYLGYGLEKAQYIEPDYEAVMLAAWILNDKQGALEKIRQQGANTAVDKATKLIKMNQGLGGTSETVTLAEQKPPVKRIPNTKNVLSRKAS